MHSKLKANESVAKKRPVMKVNTAASHANNNNPHNLSEIMMIKTYSDFVKAAERYEIDKRRRLRRNESEKRRIDAPLNASRDFTRVANLYRVTILLGTMVSPCLWVLCVSTGDDWYFMAATCIMPICGAGIIILGVTSPDNRTEDPLVVIYCNLWGLVCHVSMYLINGFWHDLLVWAFVYPGTSYFAVRSRHLLSEMPRNKMNDFVFNTVMFHGIGALPPMLYLTTDSIKCLWKQKGAQLPFLDVCGGVVVPQTSMCGFLMGLLCCRLYVFPVMKDIYSKEQIGSLEVPLKAKFQLFLFALALNLNVMQFAFMEEGPVTSLMEICMITSSISFGICIFIEVLSIRFEGSRTHFDCDDDEEGEGKGERGGATEMGLRSSVQELISGGLNMNPATDIL